MFKPRVIPVLLLHKKALYKSIGFKDHKYIGDPINAVRIFNDLRADELVFLDIDASKENRCISPEFVKKVGEESNMPFAVGGGIRTVSQIKGLIHAGAEKVIIGTAAAENPDFIREAADTFGSSTIVVCVDVKKKMWAGNRVWVKNGSVATKYDPVEFSLHMQAMGAGEIIVQSIANDGTMNGYDLELTSQVSTALEIPVVALGGAGNGQHLSDAYVTAYASGLAAGSLFVYHGTKRGVLINYINHNELLFVR